MVFLYTFTNSHLSFYTKIRPLHPGISQFSPWLPWRGGLILYEDLTLHITVYSSMRRMYAVTVNLSYPISPLLTSLPGGWFFKKSHIFVDKFHFIKLSIPFFSFPSPSLSCCRSSWSTHSSIYCFKISFPAPFTADFTAASWISSPAPAPPCPAPFSGVPWHGQFYSPWLYHTLSGLSFPCFSPGLFQQ